MPVNSRSPAESQTPLKSSGNAVPPTPGNLGRRRPYGSEVSKTDSTAVPQGLRSSGRPDKVSATVFQLRRIQSHGASGAAVPRGQTATGCPDSVSDASDGCTPILFTFSTKFISTKFTSSSSPQNNFLRVELTRPRRPRLGKKPHFPGLNWFCTPSEGACLGSSGAAVPPSVSDRSEWSRGRQTAHDYGPVEPGARSCLRLPDPATWGPAEPRPYGTWNWPPRGNSLTHKKSRGGTPVFQKNSTGVPPIWSKKFQGEAEPT